MRAAALILAALLAGGCASTRNGRPDRSMARNVLIGFAAASLALTAGAIVAGKSVQNELRDDVETGGLSGRDFASRDGDGRRWNRVARASTFAFGLSLIGLGLIWEMNQGDRLQLDSPAAPAAPAPQRSATAR